MQPQHTTSRSGGRRTPGGSGSGLGGGDRNSYTTSRSPSIRTESNLSKIEESVTNLLRATKELLETLTKWSRNSATEQEVSDIYVKLGSHFNIACRAFTAIGVETSDLGNVPDVLRTVLENTLSQDATPASLEVYLPRIREIIIDLLQGLRRKQKKLGPRAGRDTQQQPPPPPSNQQNGNSRPPGAGEPVREPQMQQQPRRAPRHDDGGSDANASNLPQRTTSLPPGAQVAQNGQFSGSRTLSQRPPNPPSSGLMGSGSAHPQDPYYHHSHLSNASDAASEAFQQGGERQGIPSELSPPPPPPPPKQDALEALSRVDNLERRASRRYSAYQVAKFTGSSPGGMAMLPGGTPMRDTRDSLRSLRNGGNANAAMRDKGRGSRTLSSLSSLPDNSIQEDNSKPESIEESSRMPTKKPAKTPDIKVAPSSEATKSPPRKSAAEPSADVLPEAKPVAGEKTKQKAADGDFTGVAAPGNDRESTATTIVGTETEDVPTTSPPPSVVHVPSLTGSESTSKELTIFLQLGRSVKKVFLQDGLEELSLNALRLLFISKFNYSPPSGDDFPEIYLQDTVSGVRYELEDMQDVKDKSIICLNVEVLDEVKRHIDDGMSGLRKMVETVHKVVESQTKAIQLVAEKQEDTSKKVTELSVRSISTSGPAVSTPTYSRFGSVVSSVIPRSGSHAQVSELQAIKKDLQTLRGSYSSFCNEMKSSFAETKRKAVARIAEASGLASEGRLELEGAKKTLSSDTDNLVSRVDDLQDNIEDLRKDVVSRGVRPLPRALENASKEIIHARKELKKMAEYIKNGKPRWKKVWERELEVVCEDQQFFNLQEELVADLQDDLDKASQTFELVEQCTEQQLKVGAGAIRSSSRGFMPVIEEPLDPSRAKDNVLLEVKALRPNHENRVEAIERAERARRKELEGRTSPFKQELGQFVEENRLKKTAGGILETERLRTLKDEEIRKGIYKGPTEASSGSEADSKNDEASLPNGNGGGQDVPVVNLDSTNGTETNENGPTEG